MNQWRLPEPNQKLWPPPRPCPISAVSLLPVGLVVGDQPATPGTVYPLLPSTYGNAYEGGGPFTFWRDMMFCGLSTHEDDARAGWMIVRNTLKFELEPLALTSHGDVPFDVFRRASSRAMTKAWESWIFLEPSRFVASAVLRGRPAPMRHGLILFFRDYRGICRGYDPAIDLPLPPEGVPEVRPRFVSRIREAAQASRIRT